MHICFATIDYHGKGGGGGIASYVSALGGELVRRGHRVSVLARGAGRPTTDEHGIRIIPLALGNLHWYLYRLRAPSLAVLPTRELEWSWAIRRAVAALHAAEPIDLVEATEAGALWLADPRRSPPLVMRLHGDGYMFAKYSGQPIPVGMRLSRQLTNRALRRANGVTAPSRFQSSAFAQALGWREDRIHVTPNPISPQLLSRALLQERVEPGQDSCTVLYAGRLEYCKGVLPLLRSVPLVASAFPAVRYLIAGGRHTSIDDAQLGQALDVDGVRRRVHLLGHLHWPQLIELYAQATIFVAPSFYESFGISILEAMACGLPVVATTAGGIPEVVEDGVTGLLVPPGDPQALAQAATSLLRDPALRQRMGQAGRERVLSSFTVERVADQSLAVYQQC
jgi:glycosyltransferase involved in cell wall biosynthesis